MNSQIKIVRTALLWRVHWWAALVASPFAVIAALTGLLYAFTPQIENMLYSKLEQVPNAQQHVALDVVVGAAQAAAPAAFKLHSVVVPGGAGESVQVTFSKGDQVTGRRKPVFGLPSAAVTVFVDPADARVLGSLANDERFRNWAKRLHSRLLQGEAWRWMIELATSWLVVMLVTGVALWWPRAAWPRLRLAGRQAWRQWHTLVGVGLSLLTLAILATGLTWSQYAGQQIRELRGMTGQASPTMPGGLASSPEPGAPRLSWQAMLNRARDLAPGTALQMTPPADARGVWRVSMADRSSPRLRFEAALDAYSGLVLYRYGWDQQPLFGKLTTVGIPFHRGELGWWNQALLVVFGVVILFSIGSGWVMYFKRRTAGRLGLPNVPAGAWRSIGPTWAAMTLAGLALMPLLALSAPCVLLADRVLARRQRPG